MAYEKQTWIDNETPVNAEHLNHIEEGVASLAEEMANLQPPAKVVGTKIGEKCAEYAALFYGTDKVDSFIFFTDPHLTEGRGGYDTQMRAYLNVLKTYYDATPTNFVVCGGDWLGNSDTIDEACFKLGYINGTMRSLVEPYYPIVGNHDTNYQGKSTADSTTLDGTLSNETIRNLFVPGEEKTYYSFEGASTTFYVLDTGSDWDGSMNAYRVEQMAWLANKLKTDDANNSAILLHIGYNASGSEYVAATFAGNVMKLCNAYNNSTSVTINSVTYDFTEPYAGKVRFAMCGHVHADHVDIVNGIPLVAVTQMRDSGLPSFDLCLADYDNNTLNLVRVGNGTSRSIAMWVQNPDDVSYTNIVASLLDYNSDAVYNNGLGYKNDVTTDGVTPINVEKFGHWFITGLIPYSIPSASAQCKPIYVKCKGIDLSRANNTNFNFSIQYHKADKSRGWYNHYSTTEEGYFYGWTMETLGDNYYRFTPKPSKIINSFGGGTAYISMFFPGAGDGLIITLDEPIE